LGQAPHSESNKKKASARLQPYNNIKQGHWPFRTELWLARAWFAGQAFQSRHIKHALYSHKTTGFMLSQLEMGLQGPFGCLLGWPVRPIEPNLSWPLIKMDGSDLFWLDIKGIGKP
jgi:hypothetical protein